MSRILPPTVAMVAPPLDVDGMLVCLRQLIAIPSVTGSSAESVAQHWFADRLKESGFETDLWQLDLTSLLAEPDFPGLEAPRAEGWGLVGSWGNSAGPTLILNGHIDVVPAGDLSQWQDGDPYSARLADGRVYGRGACDMKAGLVASLYAIKALQAAGIRLKGRVLLQSVVGEEDGGLGTFATLKRGYRGDAAIIPEPTEMAIIPACAGALTFRLRLKGLAAHASVRLDGVSTLEKWPKVWQSLTKLEAQRNQLGHPLMTLYELPYPLSIGTLQTGNWPSSVPDELVAEGRLGVALGESPEDARRELAESLAALNQEDEWLREHPVTLEWFGGQFASGQIPVEHDLVKLVSSTHQALHGNQLAIHGAPYGSDLRLMVGQGGVPTLHYGPGSVKLAHAPNEYVPVDEMIQTAQTLATIIMQFCGVEA